MVGAVAWRPVHASLVAGAVSAGSVRPPVAAVAALPLPVWQGVRKDSRWKLLYILLVLACLLRVSEAVTPKNTTAMTFFFLLEPDTDLSL